MSNTVGFNLEPKLVFAKEFFLLAKNKLALLEKFKDYVQRCVFGELGLSS